MSREWEKIAIDNLESAKNYTKLVATTFFDSESPEFDYLVSASAFIQMVIKKMKGEDND